MLKHRVASGLGCVLEWYDFALYAFFAPILAQLYFPNVNSTASTLKFFAVFAVGFICRPLGALIFGHISDAYGRATCLKLTPLLMAFPTLLLAILPTYQQIGIFAPILLLILRMVQGICIGGEFTNNIVYLCETTKPKNTYLLSSIGACTGSMGILLASTVAATMYASFSHITLLAGAWRFAFGVSLLLGVITFWMRRNLIETPVYKNLSPIKNPVFNSWKMQWQDYLLAMGIGFLPATSFYFVFVFLPNYLNTNIGLHAQNVLGDNSVSLLARLFIIPMLGILAGKIGGIRMTQLAGILFLLLSVPLFSSLISPNKNFAYALYIFALLTTLNAAATPGLMVELLRPETRCTVFSFTFNLCYGVFGGMVPYLCFLLSSHFTSKLVPAFYLVFAAMVTLGTTYLLIKRRNRYENRLQLCPDSN